ncbi:YueI family protein [Siminovitchia fortis]|uniref:YueI family protein n=1 Tax=Siminovitchia fortis TaxID=254758 RepID=UPI001FD0564E|nr:YueI family protein [Siminovitchia fortis]
MLLLKRANIEDYLEKGMYGPKQTKLEERKKFLGTIRERIVVALTKSQVMEPGIYPEVEKLMNEHPKTTLLLNGELGYSFLSDYIQKARQKKIPFSIVRDKDHSTDIGLVLTYQHAIDNKDIYIKKKTSKLSGLQKKTKNKKAPFSLVKNMFKRK